MNSKLKVAYSGIEGAFAHIAAGRIFPGCKRIAYSDFKAAYNSVEKGECDLAVLPIENSYAGEVGQTMDLIFSGNLYINGIYELDVYQNLLCVKGASLKDIKTVVSHPQALSQCHDFIEANAFETDEMSNTALAAKFVAEKGEKSYGAIASIETAELYNLDVLEKNINNSLENATRFAVLTKTAPNTPDFSSTVLMLSVKHETGSLANAINIIAHHGYNMTALRSRPMRKESWRYYFYVEIDGTLQNENGQKMFCELNEVCNILKVAGTFTPNTEI